MAASIFLPTSAFLTPPLLFCCKLYTHLNVEVTSVAICRTTLPSAGTGILKQENLKGFSLLCRD